MRLNKPKAVVFLEPKGSVFALVDQAVRNGWMTIGICRRGFDPGAVASAYREAAKSLEQIHLIESWLGDSLPLESLFESIRNNYQVIGVYSGVDATMVPCCLLRRRQGLPTTSPEAMERILNKMRFREDLRERGLSQVTAYDRAQMAEFTSWPFAEGAYFKPTFGAASAYVRYCRNLDDFRKARREWEEAGQTMFGFLADYISSGHDFLVEEEVKGELVSVEAISQYGEFHPLGLRSTLGFSRDPIVKMGGCFPYPHPLAGQMIEKVREVLKAFDFFHGPSHTELIVTQDGRIEVIDFNPRFGGGDILQVVNHAYGRKMEEHLLSNCVAEPLRLPARPEKFACLQYFIGPKLERLTEVAFPQDDAVKFTSVYVPYGRSVSGLESQLSHLGAYLVCEGSFDEAVRHSRELRKDVLINGDQPAIF